MGSRWLSYWFMPGLRTPRSRPCFVTATRATSDLAVRLPHPFRLQERRAGSAPSEVVSPSRRCTSFDVPMVLLTAMAAIAMAAPACTM